MGVVDTFGPLEGKSFISLMDLKQAYISISIELRSKSTTVGSTIV